MARVDNDVDITPVDDSPIGYKIKYTEIPLHTHPHTQRQQAQEVNG